MIASNLLWLSDVGLFETLYFVAPWWIGPRKTL